MNATKEKLQGNIEKQRKKLNESIEKRDDYKNILIISQKLDELIKQYIVMGF